MINDWLLESALAEFDRYQVEWDAWNARLYNSHPMFCHTFVHSLLQHYGDEKVLLMVHRPTGGLLLTQPYRGQGWTSFLPPQLQAAPLMLNKQAYAERMSLFKALPGFPIFIDWMAQDPMFSPCQGETSPVESRQHAATTMAITLADSFDTYWAARPKKLRNNIKRYQHRIESTGEPFSLRIHTAPQAMTGALDSYSELEAKGWKGRAGTAITAGSQQWRFYHDVLQKLAAVGSAQVYELVLGGRVVASRLAISANGMLVMLKTTYDEQLKELAVGRVLLHTLLQHEFAAGRFQRIEFYTNASADQLEWATEAREIDHITLYRSSLYASGMTVVKNLRDLTKRIGKAQPATGTEIGDTRQ
ncbi:CelD/BcsL family acetyltransferase involved in cellulose biosynthesis [Chitinivorax tropicus]|uniref:CelD/BcsL family acetyltransferase involved in cellulose biosynthesis n=1 Tax=Chitinivorax tropicus TaxID=714531 RepID=A0A840MSX2_9PROT|nr:GNAT family N-acetyltransferase [Chitinivorax tropicus]MBB5018311.1 CelD/BcsL family acetyltransferase involved in cellulose biosynthesis [Chitinivorax tropicus]